MKHGVIGEMSLTIPWSSLSSQAIAVSIEVIIPFEMKCIGSKCVYWSMVELIVKKISQKLKMKQEVKLFLPVPRPEPVGVPRRIFLVEEQRGLNKSAPEPFSLLDVQWIK